MNNQCAPNDRQAVVLALYDTTDDAAFHSRLAAAGWTEDPTRGQAVYTSPNEPNFTELDEYQTGTGKIIVQYLHKPGVDLPTDTGATLGSPSPGAVAMNGRFTDGDGYTFTTAGTVSLGTAESASSTNLPPGESEVDLPVDASLATRNDTAGHEAPPVGTDVHVVALWRLPSRVCPTAHARDADAVINGIAYCALNLTSLEDGHPLGVGESQAYEFSGANDVCVDVPISGCEGMDPPDGDASIAYPDAEVRAALPLLDRPDLVVLVVSASPRVPARAGHYCGLFGSAVAVLASSKTISSCQAAS